MSCDGLQSSLLPAIAGYQCQSCCSASCAMPALHATALVVVLAQL
jgi:hypothetical protein